jgi:hypothetical protein
MAQPIVVADATAESGAAAGPSGNHGTRPYSGTSGGVKRAPAGIDHAVAQERCAGFGLIDGQGAVSDAPVLHHTVAILPNV